MKQKLQDGPDFVGGGHLLGHQIWKDWAPCLVEAMVTPTEGEMWWNIPEVI